MRVWTVQVSTTACWEIYKSRIKGVLNEGDSLFTTAAHMGEE